MKIKKIHRRREMSDTVVLRRVFAVNSNTGLFLSTNQILVTDGLGGTTWQPILGAISSVGGPPVGILPSTLSTISTTLFLAQGTILDIQYAISTNNPGAITLANLLSTTAGLGSASYISSPQLISTVEGLGSVGYISTQGLGQALQSTTIGLGSAGYISSTNALDFSSTLEGLGSAGYISSASLQSTLDGLSQLNYISSASLQSTLAGLGSLGYISTQTLAASLVSTVRGAGSAGYVSTAGLNTAIVSTTIALSTLTRNIRFDNAGNVFINNSEVTFTNAANSIFISSFTQSSILAFGATSINAAVNTNSNLIFSTASFSLSAHKAYLQSTSYITLDYQPNIAFSRLGSGASGPVILPISTFIQYNGTILSTVTTNYLFAWAQSSIIGPSAIPWPNSNYFQVPIRLQISPSTINEVSSSHTLLHMIPGGISYGGYVNALGDSNLTSYYATPGSLYLTVENKPR